MSTHKIKVQEKKRPQSSSGKFRLAGIFIVIILFTGISVFAVVSYSGIFSPAALEIVTEGNRQIIRVPAGGDLQAAIKKAQSGDIIELQAGATYYGEIKLPNKPLTDYITIQTSALRQLPENARVKPSQSPLMAKIVTGKSEGTSAVSTEHGAHHYRFIGIEFASNTTAYVYNLVLFGLPDKLADVPHHLEVDRCYFRSLSTGVTRRGLALNSAETTIKNSYFEGFAYPQEETQGISGWTGTKNVKILNNYIEGGAENILIGGGDPSSVELTPMDIEIRGNLLPKRSEWRGKATTKTLFEVKNAKRLSFTGNFLENNFVDSAFRVTVRNEAGKAPFSTIEDVEIKNNIIKGAAEGINILGKDGMQISQTLKRLKIVNNLWLDLDSSLFNGSGYFVQITDGEDVEVSRNTVFQTGNMIKAYGAPTRNFIFRDNILNYGEYGFYFEPSKNFPTAAQYFGSVMKNNVVVNKNRVSDGELSIPPGNFKVNDSRQIGFTNPETRGYTLSPASAFKSKGNIGVNMEEIRAVMPPEDFKRLLQ